MSKVSKKAQKQLDEMGPRFLEEPKSKEKVSPAPLPKENTKSTSSTTSKPKSTPPAFYNDENSLRSEVLLLLVDQNPATKKQSLIEAQELLVNHLVFKFKLKTIMQDEKEEVWGYKKGIYLPIGKSLVKEDLRRILDKGYNKTMYNNVIEKIMPSTFINANDFFTVNHIDYVPVENGLLNIKTSTLEPFTPDKIFFNKLPVKYNLSSSCPTIKNHLKTVLKSDKDVLLFQEFLGFCLLKDMKWEKSVMFLGHGRNGKSLLLSCVNNLFGAPNSSSIDLQTLEDDQWALAGLFQKYVNISGDLPKEALKNTGNFKKATGGDRLWAPRKFLSPLEFINYAKFLFACNHLPKTSDLSDGFFSRWLIFDFPYKFVTQQEINNADDKTKEHLKLRDDSLKDKLNTQEELEGFLLFGLEGLKRLLENDGFSVSKTDNDTKDLWLSRSDSSIGFSKKFIVRDVTTEPMPVDELFSLYINYCSENNFDILKKSDLNDALASMFGSIRKKVRCGNETPFCYTNIKIKMEVKEK